MQTKDYKTMARVKVKMELVGATLLPLVNWYVRLDNIPSEQRTGIAFAGPPTKLGVQCKSQVYRRGYTRVQDKDWFGWCCRQ